MMTYDIESPGDNDLIAIWDNYNRLHFSQAPLKLTSDTGSLMPTLDRPEQAIDLLQDAITQAGLTPGEDFHIALNCAAHEIFDFVSI